jgi:hypothetical protein
LRRQVFAAGGGKRLFPGVIGEKTCMENRKICVLGEFRGAEGKISIKTVN